MSSGKRCLWPATSSGWGPRRKAGSSPPAIPATSCFFSNLKITKWHQFNFTTFFFVFVECPLGRLPSEQRSGDFWAQPAQICPFITTSTGFLRIWPVANLLPSFGPANILYTFSSAGWFLLHCNDDRPRLGHLISKPVFQCSRIMKCNNYEAKASPVRHSPNRYKPATDKWLEP